MYNVFDTLFSHKASFSQGRYLHLFPSLDINLLLNAIEKCRCMYINFLTAVYTKYMMNTYDAKLYLEPNLIHIFF